jgi:5-methyltetrahydrofolate--homocysteine methyltransferase
MNKIFNLPLLLDGATGTNLMRTGMPSGTCAEEWMIENPQAVTELQKAYAQAGSGAVMSPTFETNRYKLSRFGQGCKVKEFNRQLVAISRAAVGSGVLVAGDISPTGLFTEPFGDTTFDELTDIYREQAFALLDAGADYIAIETMISLTEARAALLAAKETGLPVTVTLTVEKKGRTLSGGNIAASLVTLAAMGADAVGVNCSTGPDIVLAALRAASPYINLPLIAKPNAGLPKYGQAGVYDITPEKFAAYLPEFLELGVGLIGGCCGTTPEHIRLLKEALSNAAYIKLPCQNALNEGGGLLAASERSIFKIIKNDMALIHKLECDDSLAENLTELCSAGDGLVQINIRDEREVGEFVQCAYLATLPLILASDDAAVLEAALKLYQGRALIDQNCGIGSDKITELSHRYGAAIL